MSREYPDWVNPWKAADGKRSFSGTMALGRMTRLAPMLASVDGLASFEARFFRDALGWAVIQLDVKADLKLRCQASLEVYTEQVSRSSALAAVEEPERADDLPEHYDLAPLEEGRVVFLDLVQDELILAVPQVPRKPGLEAVQYSTDPNADSSGSSQKRESPFAVLGGLLKDGPKDSNHN